VNSVSKAASRHDPSRYNGCDFDANLRDAMVSNVHVVRRTLDWAKAAEWTAHIVEERLQPIRDVFHKEGAQGPVIVWNPTASAMAAPPLAALVEYWTALRVNGALPLADRIDPLEMRRALGYVMLVDVIENGEDFRYRLFGSAVAAVSGFDMTGRRLSEHAASAYLLEFSLALYRAALQRKEPVFSQYAPVGTKVTAEWHRVALPLADSFGAVVRLLAGTVPLGRDGRIVPVRF